MLETIVPRFVVLPALLVAGLALIALVLGRRRPALRHRIVVLGLGAAVLLPLLAAALPASARWSPARWSELHRVVVPIAAGPDVAARARRAAAGRVPVAPGERDPAQEELQGQPAGGPAPAIAPDEQADRVGGSPAEHFPWLIAVGLAGVVLTGSRPLVGGLLLARLARGASRCARLDRLVDRLAVRSGVNRRVDVMTSADLAVPVTWGWRRPRIAVPSAAEGWPFRRLEAILLHELAHVRRGDALAQRVLDVAEALYWWNPLVWWLGRLARGDAELASDALAASGGPGSLGYARELVAVLRFARGRLALRAGLPFGGLPVARRIEALCRTDRPSGLLSRTAAGTVLAAVLLPAAALAAIGPERQVPTVAEAKTDLHGPGAGVSGDAVQEAVRSRLTDPDPAVRRSAVNALRDLDPVAARRDPALRPLLSDPDSEVRRATETVVGLRVPKPNMEFQSAASSRRRPGAGEVERLGETLTSAGAKERERAVAELRGLDDRRVSPLLLAALRDPSEHVRQTAASALGSVGDPLAVPGLVRSLDDADEHVRQAAAGALGDLRDARAVPALTAALADSDEHVRQVAAGALGRIGSASATSLEALAAASRDPDEHVRQAAVDALGDVGDPAATPVLLAALEDVDPFVRRSALSSLTELHRAGVERP